MNVELKSYRKNDSQTLRIGAASAAALLLRGVLDFAYVNYVDRFFAESFAAGFFPFDGLNTLRMVESYVLTLVLATWLVSSLYRRWRPSGVVLVLYFVVVMLPLSSLYGLTGAHAPFVYAAAGSFAVLIVVTGLLPRVKVPRPSRELVYLGVTAVLGICVYVYGWLVFTGGLERLSFDLLSVYEVRAEFIQARAPLMGYFVPWQANVINILILCYALARRNYGLLAVAAAAQLLLFGMTGLKSFLFAPVLAGGVYFIWDKRNALFYIVGGSLMLILASYIVFLGTGNHLVPSISIRRLFFVPAANHVIYYDFFSQPGHPFVMLSNSILEPFIRYPYSMSLTRVISWAYWGSDFGPNVGYLGDAFAHFGFVGMFLFSIILGLFLRILDSVGARFPSNLMAAIVAVPAMALTNSALFTSLLTHGLILALVMIWLLGVVVGRRTKRSEAKRVRT